MQASATEATERFRLAVDVLLDLFEECAGLEGFEPMPEIVAALEARGVELPPWLLLMI